MFGSLGRQHCAADCRTVTCVAVPAPECHCHWTVDCFADVRSHDPCFVTHPGYPTDGGSPPGMLRLASAKRPESERSHRDLGAVSQVTDVVTLSDSSEDEDPGLVCDTSPFQKKVTDQLARETAAFVNRPAFVRTIPLKKWAAAGSKRGPKRKSVRMYLLRTVLNGAARITEDIIGLSDAAPSSRTAGAPTQSRTADNTCGCHHGNKAAEMPNMPSGRPRSRAEADYY